MPIKPIIVGPQPGYLELGPVRIRTYAFTRTELLHSPTIWKIQIAWKNPMVTWVIDHIEDDDIFIIEFKPGEVDKKFVCSTWEDFLDLYNKKKEEIGYPN